MNREKWYLKIISRCNYDNWCFVWQWAKNDSWYGVQNICWKFRYVHRFIYDYLVGIDEWMTVDHICHNKLCCELSHLRLLTPKENSKDGGLYAAKKTRKLICDKCWESRIIISWRLRCRKCLNKYMKNMRLYKKGG